LPSLSSAIKINIRDATAAVPGPSYGKPIVIGEDATNKALFNQVFTYYSQSEVENDFGADSPIAKATAKAFMQGISEIKVVNVMKDDGAGGAIADYDTVLADLAERAEYDIIIPTIGAGDANAQKLIDHAGVYRKLLVLPFIGAAADAKTAFAALTVNEFVYAIAYDDSSLTEGEVAGAVGGVVATLKPWQTPEWVNVQGVNPASYIDSQVDDLENSNIATIYEIVKSVLSNARTLDGGRVYIVRSKIYLADIIRTELINLKLKLNNMGKAIPFAPSGLQVIKSTIEKILRAQQALGVLKPDWTDADGNLHRGFEVTVPAYEDIPDSDKSNGILRNVSVTAYLMNYVEKIELDLVITL
jgi:hypothetical protein